jgi:hypothetical protein
VNGPVTSAAPHDLQTPLTAERLPAELGSGEVLFDGRFFVAVRSSGS